MSADELDERDRKASVPVEILDALKGRWLRTKQLQDALPHIARNTLKGQLDRLMKAGFLWRRELDPASLSEFERNTRRGSSTAVYEYRCKFM